MRPPSLVFALLLTACTGAESDTPGKNTSQADKAPTPAEPEPDTEGEHGQVKQPGNVIIKTEAELAAESSERMQCVASCVEANVAVAKPADVIEADCRTKCDEKHPPVQVEVRPQ